MSIYFRDQGLRSGREDISDCSSLKRPMDFGIDTLIQQELDYNKNTSTRMIGNRMNILHSTVIDHHRGNFGMRNMHPCWFLYKLDAVQKNIKTGVNKRDVKSIRHRKDE